MEKKMFVTDKRGFLLAFLTCFTLSMSVSCGGVSGKGEVETPNVSVIVGIDISEYQGQIEWERLAIAKEVVDSCVSVEDRVGLTETLPVRFAIVRATKSSGYVDKLFERNYKAARQQGICVGAYHFLTDSVSGKLQAENYINVVKLEKDDLPPVLDVEVFSPQVIDIAKEWLSVVEEHYGRQAIVYSNQSGYNDIIMKDSVLKSRDLWLAQLISEKPSMENCKFWQLSHKGQVIGIRDCNVDINLFLGDNAKFEKYAKGEDHK